MTSSTGLLLRRAFAVVFVLTISAVNGDVLVGPANDAVVTGDSVSFTCSATTSGNERVQFLEFATNANGALISDGEYLMPGHPNKDRYVLNVDLASGSYSLTVSPTVVADGGRFACVDINQLPVPVYYNAHLVVFDGMPNCTTTLPADRNVIVMSYYTCECSTFFQSTYQVRPTSIWSGPGEFTQAMTYTNTSTWSGAAFYIMKGMDGQSFDCLINFEDSTFNFTDGTTATNVPTFSFTYSTGPLNVRYAPTNQTYYPAQPSYEIGQVLTCWADAMPPPSYTWTNMITQDSYPSQTLTLTPDMVGRLALRCQALNIIGSADLFINITLNPITTTSTPGPTTPTTTVAPVAPCDPLNGRWEYGRPDGTVIALCLFYDYSVSTLYGLVMNTTNDPFATDAIGYAREPSFSDFGIVTQYASSGVGSFAGECRKCYGTEYMIVNGVSRSSLDAFYCNMGSDIISSPAMTFFRVPVRPPCPTTTTEWQSYIAKKQLERKMP